MYISGPTTNSETTNPEFFMIFLANQIFFDEKRIRNKLTMFICKLVLFFFACKKMERYLFRIHKVINYRLKKFSL